MFSFHGGQVQKRHSFFSFILVILFMLSIFVSASPVQAYNSLTHRWIFRKAIAYLKQTRSMAVKKQFPLEMYIEWLGDGSDYADHNSLTCSWYFLWIDREFACDTMHHYAQNDVIETLFGVDIGHPGDITADVYMLELFEVAKAFYPQGTTPSLQTLKQMRSGYRTLGISPKHYFDPMWVGGLPFCSEASAAPCPQWAEWAYSNGSVVENQENAMKHLGWSLHMLQDLTVYHHEVNNAESSHESYEDMIDEAILNGMFNHLPVQSITEFKYWDRIYFSNSNMAETFPSFSDLVYEKPETVAAWHTKLIGPPTIRGGVVFTSKGYAEYRVDAAIKLTAAMIEQYFRTEYIKPIDGPVQ